MGPGYVVRFGVYYKQTSINNYSTEQAVIAWQIHTRIRRFRTQNLNPMEADFSWLRHNPGNYPPQHPMS